MTHRLGWMGAVVLLALAWLPGRAEAQCSYSISPVLDFGQVTGGTTPQIDVTATISVTCSSLISVNRRVCLSMPAGTGGLSLADRRMVTPDGDFVQYQLYTNPGRTNVWGELGGAFPPVTVDFLLLIGQRTENVTVYGRVFGGQTGKAVGAYLSNLTTITGRWANALLTGCGNLTTNPTVLPTLPVTLAIEPDCAIAANPLQFGSVTSLTGHQAASNVSVTCTLGAAYTVHLDGGSVTGSVSDRQMQHGAATDTVAYQLYRDSGHMLVWGDTPETGVAGTGTGSPQSIPVHGLVPAQDARPPGVYTDTITATVVF